MKALSPRLIFRIGLFTAISFIIIAFILFSALYDTNINVEQLVSQRISVVILSKEGKRNTNILKSHFPQASISIENKVVAKAKAKDNSLEDLYKEKYIQELEYFVDHGKTMLVMLLEDDVVSVYTNKTLWYHLAINTIPLFANDLANFDCSKRGFLLKTGSDGNKSLCRIFSKETLKSQIECMRSITDPIDVTINYCQEKLNITQKRFLAFVHSGMPSLIGHSDTGFI